MTPTPGPVCEADLDALQFDRAAFMGAAALRPRTPQPAPRPALTLAQRVQADADACALPTRFYVWLGIFLVAMLLASHLWPQRWFA